MSKWTPGMEAEMQYWAENSSAQVGIEGETLTAALAEIRRLRAEVEQIQEALNDDTGEVFSLGYDQGALDMQAKCADIAASHGEEGYRAALEIEALSPEDV